MRRGSLVAKSGAPFLQRFENKVVELHVHVRSGTGAQVLCPRLNR